MLWKFLPGSPFGPFGIFLAVSVLPDEHRPGEQGGPGVPTGSWGEERGCNASTQ